MFPSTSGGEGMTSQLQAELADFEEILREHKVDLNPSKDIRLTSQEYEDTMQILEEFLEIQEGFAFEHENNPSIKQLNNVEPMEEDVAINFDDGVPAPGFSVAEMKNLYLADVDVEMEFMDLNSDPVCSIDLNELELDDLFYKGIDKNTSPPYDKPVLVAEKPHSSEDVQDPGYIDGIEHQYGSPPDLIAQVNHNDLKDKDISPVDIKYNHIPAEDMPTDSEDIPTDTDDDITDTDASTEPEDNSNDIEDLDITSGTGDTTTTTDTDNIPTSTHTDDIPIDTDDISTEPEDNSTDNEDIPTILKNISTGPFATLPLDSPGSFWEPFPFNINTWMMNREKDRKEKLKKKTKKIAATSPTTTISPSGTKSQLRRRLFFENRKEPSPIPESRSPTSQIRTRKSTKAKTSLCKTADKEKAKKTKQSYLIVKKEPISDNTRNPRRRRSTDRCRSEACRRT